MSKMKKISLAINITGFIILVISLLLIAYRLLGIPGVTAIIGIIIAIIGGIMMDDWIW